MLSLHMTTPAFDSIHPILSPDQSQGPWVLPKIKQYQNIFVDLRTWGYVLRPLCGKWEQRDVKVCNSNLHCLKI